MGQISGLGKFQMLSGDVYLGGNKNGIYHGTGLSIWKTGQTRFDTKYHEGPSDGLPSNSTVHTVFPSLKKQFSEMAVSKREKIQSKLMREGLYASSIDGKWGRGTLTALVEFSLKNLATVDLRSASMSKKLLDAVLR